MKHTVVMRNPQQGHEVLHRMWAYCKPYLMAGHTIVLKAQEETRSLEQNAKMWACLTDISRQVEWYGKRLEPEDWKHVFSASLRKLAVVPNLDGTGFVALGLSTSSMTKREMIDLIDVATAFGNERGVVWSDEHEEATA